MANTTYVDNVGPQLKAAWLNDVNTTTYIGASALLGTASGKMPTISATIGSSALTIGMSSVYLDFRSATIGDGTISTILAAPSNLVVPSTATLGTVNAVQSRLVVLAINNAGTIELAVVNIAGGNDLTETGVISTTTIAGGSNTANVIYSTTGRSNVSYRVVGYVESTQATAGTWATAPSTIQGAGGNALTAMSSLGYGQTWQAVTRTAGTTYYNTTGKPIQVNAWNAIAVTSDSVSLSVNGLQIAYSVVSVAGALNQCFVSAIVPPGASYVRTDTGSSATHCELR